MHKLLFCNTGWMDQYQGLSHDSIQGGGKHVRTHGWGGEMYNFKKIDGMYYGYVQPKIDRETDKPTTIRIENLGASKIDKKIDGITIVWLASDPINRGTKIVGWYESATVYRYAKTTPRSAGRNHGRQTLPYFITSKGPVRLIPTDERRVPVKRGSKGWLGQSNVWYATDQPGFVKAIENYIFKDLVPAFAKLKKRKGGKGTPRQPDVLKRIKVEQKAVRVVTKYYRDLDYDVKSVEKDNVGWDLVATKGKVELKLEVKGLSGKNIYTELTHNEYTHVNAHKDNYRICVVTDTLVKPKLHIFSHSAELGHWKGRDSITLSFQERTSAIIFVN